MRNSYKAVVLFGAAGAALTLGAAAEKSEVKQVVTGPVAQYWVSSETHSGLSLGGAGKPSMSDMMGMMGGGSNVGHSLILQLGSNQGLAGAEGQASHAPPEGLGTGPLPLYYKAPVASTPQPDMPTEEKTYEPPKGKILLFWGCGEKAGPGQPVVIDLSKIMDPQERASMMSKMGSAITLTPERPPSPARFKTYGEWPNSKSRKSIKGDASLVGAHTIAGNYSPTINFTLSQAQDFLGPIEVTQNSPLPSGAVGLAWQSVPQAKAYFASTIGGSGGGADGATAVFWNSSDVQTGMLMAAMNYLSPADIDRLLAQRVLLSPQTTRCAVPSEVIKAAPQSLYSLNAYGTEANFAYPARPVDPKVAWNIEWTAKVRYRSTTGGLLGQSMGGSSDPNQPKKKKGGIMGDLIKGGLGF